MSIVEEDSDVGTIALLLDPTDSRGSTFGASSDGGCAMSPRYAGALGAYISMLSVNPVAGTSAVGPLGPLLDDGVAVVAES